MNGLICLIGSWVGHAAPQDALRQGTFLRHSGLAICLSSSTLKGRPQGTSGCEGQWGLTRKALPLGLLCTISPWRQ